MKNVKFISFLIVLGFLLPISVISTSPAEKIQPIAGNTLYVGMTSTYKTIKGAVENSTNGDTIIVENGTYYESLEIDRSITLIGNSSTDCKIWHYSNRTNRFYDFSAAINISSNWVNISGFKITAAGNFTHGICVKSSVSNSNITQNIISTIGRQCLGIMFYYSGINNTIKDNIIHTTNSYGFGIYIYNSDKNAIKNNDIITEDQFADGILIGDSDANIIQSNQVQNQHSSAVGIELNSFSLNNILTNNNITGPGFYGIRLTSSSDNELRANNVIGRGDDGIQLEANSNNNNISFNMIKDNSMNGINIYNSQLNNIYNNELENNLRKALYISGSMNNNIFNNNVITKVFQGFGIQLDLGSTNNILRNNTINTDGNLGLGIFITQGSNSNSIIENKINTSGQSSYGIQIDNSDKNLIEGCHIVTSNITSPGFYLDGKTALIINSTITTSASSNDLVVVNDANMTVINCLFSKVVATTGVVQVKNHLDIQVYYEDATTTIEDADVKITDNNITIYSSPGYGGTDLKTAADGKLENIVIPDRWYFYQNSAKENITNISVMKIIDKSWEETKTNVNMSLSHTETFISEDIRKPPIPSNLIITRIYPKNDLNISWDDTVDTVKYTVWAIKDFAWSILSNVTPPKNWIIDKDLQDNLTHYYRIESWDAVGFSSGLSGTKDFFLEDITPPMVPMNLKVVPVLGDDALNISWDSNSDDTIKYELWWDDPTARDLRSWEIFKNIQYPNNYYIFRDDKLKNGTPYNFRIRAWDKVGLPSNFTNPINAVHRDYIAPSAPMNLMANAVSDTKIQLNWQPSPDPDVIKYFIYSTQPAGTYLGPYYYKGQANQTTYTVTGLLENVDYYFVVRAVDEANNTSPNSLWVNISTKAIPPQIPDVDQLPEYYNINTINVTGKSDIGTKIVIYNFQQKLTVEGTTNASGGFKIQVELDDGLNSLKVGAYDQANVFSGFSKVQNVTVDIEPPLAVAGDNIAANLGSFITLDGSGSLDNYGIASFDWTFNYNNSNKHLGGEVVLFEFNLQGNYRIILTVTDLAGNQDDDFLWVNITTPLKIGPKVKSTDPVNNSIDVPIDKVISIEFDMTMDIESVENSLLFIPQIDHVSTWSQDHKILFLAFQGGLSYNTNYTILFGPVKSKDGGILQNGSYLFKFRTVKAPVIPKLTITEPLENAVVEPGETITVSGSSVGITENSEVTVTIKDKKSIGRIKSDGTWSVEIKVPYDEGKYNLTVSAGDVKKTIEITVQYPEQPPEDDDDEKEDLGLFGFGPGIDNLIIGLIIVFIIAIVIIIAVAKTRSKRYDKDEQIFFEEETEE